MKDVDAYIREGTRPETIQITRGKHGVSIKTKDTQITPAHPKLFVETFLHVVKDGPGGEWATRILQFIQGSVK